MTPQEHKEGCPSLRCTILHDHNENGLDCMRASCTCPEEKERCTKCGAPFEPHHHKHIIRKGVYHTSCYDARNGDEQGGEKDQKAGETLEERFLGQFDEYWSGTSRVVLLKKLLPFIQQEKELSRREAFEEILGELDAMDKVNIDKGVGDVVFKVYAMAVKHARERIKLILSQ